MTETTYHREVTLRDFKSDQGKQMESCDQFQEGVLKVLKVPEVKKT